MKIEQQVLRIGQNKTKKEAASFRNSLS